MASFFGKLKVPTRAPSKEADSVVAGPSRIQSDFERTFKSFVIKKDTQLAPINWFSASKKRMRRPPSVRMDGDVIVIDEEDPRKVFDVEMDDAPPSEGDVSRLTCQGWYLLRAVQQSCS
jgi:chromatin assembly factor 1 subunit A